MENNPNKSTDSNKNKSKWDEMAEFEKEIKAIRDAQATERFNKALKEREERLKKDPNAIKRAPKEEEAYLDSLLKEVSEKSPKKQEIVPDKKQATEAAVAEHRETTPPGNEQTPKTEQTELASPALPALENKEQAAEMERQQAAEMERQQAMARELAQAKKNDKDKAAELEAQKEAQEILDLIREIEGQNDLIKELEAQEEPQKIYDLIQDVTKLKQLKEDIDKGYVDYVKPPHLNLRL